MTRRRGLLFATLCLILAACGSTAVHRPHVEPRRVATKPTAPAPGATSPAKPASVAIGLADNDAEFLTDPRFLALGITFVRDEIPWNALLIPYQRERLTRWLDAARADDFTALVTFDHAAPPLRHTLPSVAEFSTLFKQFRADYPWVTEFVTWNEANEDYPLDTGRPSS